MTRTELLATFAEPPAEYGPFAWYWLNGEANAMDRVTWQLERLAEHGFGGITAALHSHGSRWFLPRAAGQLLP